MEHDSEVRFDLNTLIERHLRLAHSGRLFDRFIGCVCLAEELRRRLAELPDRQVANLLDLIVCDCLQAFSPEAVIGEQAVRRLFRSGAGSLAERGGQNSSGSKGVGKSGSFGVGE